MAQAHVYVPRQLTDAAMETVQRIGHPVVAGGEDPPSRQELLQKAKGAAAIVSTLTERIDAELLDAAGPTLKVVANVAVGYDNIDVPAATERNVRITNTPGVLDGATADLAMALILATARRVMDGDNLLRSRTPWVWGPRMLLGLDLSAGTTLGVVGFGRIGRAVARRAKAFDMEILATPTRSELSAEDRTGVTFLELPELLERSDVVTVHVPLNDETRDLIDAEALRRMKSTAILVNTARGGIVNEKTLVEALHAGTIGGAGLDVFEGEPNVSPEVLDAPNTVVTPHIGSAGTATRDRMCELAVRNAAAVLAGDPPPTPVN